MTWYVSRINKINKKAGTLEVYCHLLNKFIAGKIPPTSNFQLGDKVRIRLEVLSYVVRIKTIIPARKA